MRRLFLTTILLLALSLVLTGAVSASTINQSPSNVTTNLNTGLVGWWTFDGADVTSTQVLDKSGNLNHGARNGGVAVAKGKIGQAGKFDGVNDYVNASTSSPVNNLKTFSVSVWVNPKALDNQQVIAAKGGGVAGWVLKAYTGSEFLDNYVYTDGINARSLPNTVLPLNKWTYLVMTYDDTGDRKIHNYFNTVEGTYVVQTAATGNVLDDTAYGLGFGAGGYAYWNGLEDDVRYYNRAFSTTEIQQLYRMGK